MSRLGDLIRLERSRRGLSAKQVAKKCGVSESYLLAVENGTKIIADDQARRILKSMGMQQQTEADFSLDDIAATVDLQSASDTVQRAQATQHRLQKTRPEAEKVAATEPEGVAGSIWLDALSSVLRRVPVYNAVMKETGHRLLPLENGKIENAPPDKVFYFTAPDNDMRGFRVTKGDLVLVVPASSPADGAMMLIQTPQGRVLRMIKRLDNFKILLQRYDAACESEVAAVEDVHVVGRCVRLEAEL
ncbi:MAG: helix-turn-helix transcriptional regulator [Clostridia bacterium]|nr:helix-turn-helix transcriptional regulator [Clostridia bacterium]